MTPLFKKLNLRSHKTIHVLNAPESFEAELRALEGVTVKRSLSGNSKFALAFAVTQAEVDSIAVKLVKASTEDVVLWMIYPKVTSTRYACEFNRDTGWAVLRKGGFESVRIVAMDEDRSALRFRRTGYIEK